MSSEVTRGGLSLGEKAVLVFTVCYMAAWLPFLLLFRNREFVLYFAVMCALLAVVWRVQQQLRLHIGALWGLSLWGLLHMAGGLMPIPSWWPRLGESQVLYNAWLLPGVIKYDQLVHAAGFGLVTWICWQGLQRAFAARGISLRPTLGLMILCVAAGTGFGAANEVVEFAATLVIPGTNVGGYHNTGWDLVANLVGSMIAATVIYLRPPDRRRFATTANRQAADEGKERASRRTPIEESA
jgi:hypothetical protein